MSIRFLSSLSLVAGMSLAAQAETLPYPDSDSSDGYDSAYYAESYSGSYHSAPAPVSESSSTRSIFPTSLFSSCWGRWIPETGMAM